MTPGLEIEILPPDDGTLASLCTAAFERVRRFFPAGPPDRVETFRQAAERARGRASDETYGALGEILRPSGAAAERRLRQVVRGRGVVVTTGQQAGLFTGPLYTLYKAITAARLADALERQLGLPVLPVFWVASEDHDWSEASHVHVVDLENQLRRIEVRAPFDPDEQATPIFRIHFEPDVARALEDLRAATPDSEFKDDVLGPLGKAYRPGAGVAEAFADALADLTRSFPLCLVDAADPRVKRLSVPILRREWSHRQEAGERLVRWAAELGAAGFEPQVRIDPESTNLFVEGARGRDRLTFGAGKGKGRLRRSGEEIEEKELLRLLDESPERIHPNVLLRPVVESALLPVVGYVGGPSEIAYFAQLPPLFELHGLTPPPIVPRASVRLLERRVAKGLQRAEVTAEELAEGPETVARRAARDRMPAPIASALAALREVLQTQLEEIRAGAAEIEPPLEGAVGRAGSQVERALHDLEAKITTSLQRRNEILLDQLRKAATHLMPLGQPQERVLNVYPYLVRYGRDLLAAIAEQIHPRLE